MNLAGNSVNPYTTIKLKGVPLRTHNFRWKFSPENPTSTDEIEKIIKAIRVRMHPIGGQLFLQYPELVNFRIHGPENPNHEFPTAPCLITSFNVDRTGGDYPTFFATTGTPVVYAIFMTVAEILPLLRIEDNLGVSNHNLTSNVNELLAIELME